MDVIVEFNEAAFRHGISKEDILHALKTKIHAALIEGYPEKYAVIGLNRAGNPLEILYNLIDDNTINVFHAMEARNSFIKMLGL
jgi:molybdopterin-guanine dinucleotide biosynthesis protein